MAIDPVGVPLIDAFGDLGKVRPGDDLHAPLVAFVHQPFEIEAVQPGAPGLVRQVRGIAGDQARRVEHDGVAGEGIQRLNKPVRIEIPGVDLPKVGLDHPPRVICPPIRHGSAPFFDGFIVKKPPAKVNLIICFRVCPFALLRSGRGQAAGSTVSISIREHKFADRKAAPRFAILFSAKRKKEAKHGPFH